MKKYLNKFAEIIASKIAISYPYKTQVEVVHSLFSYISISRLREIIDKAEKEDEKYVSLAEMFGDVLRENLAKENNEILHRYHDLLPKLDQYSKAFNKVILDK